MDDKRIDEAFELLKQAFILLDEVAHDKKIDDACIRSVCSVCCSMICSISESLASLVG